MGWITDHGIIIQMQKSFQVDQARQPAIQHSKTI